MHPFRRRRLACCVLLAAGFGPAGADDLFRVSAVVGTQTGSVSYQTAQQAFDGLGTSALTALVPSYNVTQTASIALDYRGLLVSLAYPVPSGPQLTLNVPQIGLAETFAGSTREDSRLLLREYFKNGGGLGRIFKALAERSPVDPIAGNPTSLQSQMVASSFDRNFRGLVTSAAAGSPLRRSAAAAPRPLRLASASSAQTADMLTDGPADGTLLSVELDVARYSRPGSSSLMTVLPLRWTPALGSERPLSVDAELHHVAAEGTQTLGGQLGASYRLRAGDGWFLVPSLGVGAVGSGELGSGGTLASASLTSAYRLTQQAGYTLWLGNAVNVLQTLRTSAAGYSANPKLRNTAFTNGLLLSLAGSPLWRQQWLEFSFADTRYTGAKLYDRRYDEIAVALVGPLGGTPGSTLRGEIRYLDTSNSKGVGLRLQATF